MLGTQARFGGPGRFVMGRASDPPPPTFAASPFDGDSEMAARMRVFDWSSTPLGPPQLWPESLRTACRICLTSRFPILLWWGPQLRMLYNDAYAPVLGHKHPALARPGAQVWADVWPIVGPMLDSVLAGDATWSDDQLLPMYRHGYWEEAYFTFSYSPIHEEDGTVGGVFTAATETTGRVLGERRMRTLRELGDISAIVAPTVEQALETTLDVLAGNRADIPYALAYLLDQGGDNATLVGSYGVAVAGTPVPTTVPRSGGDDPVRRVASTGAAELVTGLPIDHASLDGANPVGDAPPDSAMLVPVTAAGQDRPAAVLVLAVSPYRELDDAYRSFFELVAGQATTAVTAALAYAAERHRAAALAELDRAKGEFFANISHELRTPLTLIAGPAEDGLADTSAPLPAVQRERMQLIRRNAGRLRKMVDDMLDFARVESGRLLPAPAPTYLASLTREIVDSFAPAVHRAGLALHVQCPPLPRPVAVDADMWEKVVLNLLSNATKYTHEGSIRVGLREAGDHIELAVADTGVGIPAGELPLLFQRFHRVRGSNGRSHEGAGIGLALVHELVRLHGGTVSATSAEGVGSTFTVRIPATGTAAAVDPSTAVPPRDWVRSGYREEASRWSADEPDEPQPGVARTTDVTVLVVEDNADLRGYLARLLEPPWRVLQASDGRAALAIAREQLPDLVLSDVMTPELDGVGLLRELRADPATEAIPVVFLSARAGEEAAFEGLDAGADDYLPKPFSAQELVARVRSNLELARLRTRESGFRRAVVDSLQEGFFVTDAEGSITEINAAFGKLIGYGPEGVPYRYPYPWLVDPDEDPAGRQSSDAARRAVASDGSGQFVLPLRHRDGHRLWAAVSVALVPGKGGRRMAVGTARDVTAERATIDREAVLAHFSETLAGAFGVTEVLTAGLAELQTAFTPTSAVTVLWPGDGADASVVSASTVSAWTQLDQRSRDALRRARHLPTGQVTVRPAPGAPGQAGMIAAPLGDDAAVALGFETPRPLTVEDRTLFGSLTAHLTRLLTRARRYDDARAVALTLQRSILGPIDLPLAFAVRYEPAVQPMEVGGDWYDVVMLPAGRTGIVVGDCVGRGLPAAAVMGQLRSACRALLLRATGPRQVLTELDEFAGRVAGAKCSTVFCAIIDSAEGMVRYSCGGHLPAVLCHPDGSSELLDGARSLPMGVDPGRRRLEATASLQPGSTLLLYTDGLVERRRMSLDIGLDAIRRLVAEHGDRAPEELADLLLADRQPDAGYDDDVAVLVYRHPPQPLRVELPADAIELARLRRDLRQWLAASLIPVGVAEDAVLAVDEACSNAIVHGAGGDPARRVTVTARLVPERLTLAVADTGTWKPPGDDPGRGLVLMRAVLDEVSIDDGATGTTVRMAKLLPV